ncbi:DUF1223 domain-containing protein [Flagellimonas lutimaris]|uniref:DUF1223 domain-containing protein n=1 Tax=Flagellimonas lutimaris TaxID=475082 RepID=UPI003F5CD789
MIKKAIILSFTFFALSLYTLYTANEVKPVVQENKNPIVLELFTSQGCSSCPPADALLKQIKSKYPNDIIALSYHVDYWDYIGWKDPFSNQAHTKKQREYGRKFNQRNIYTPQMVINGKEHFVGSNSSILYSKIKEYGIENSSNPIEICGVELSNGTISFSYNTIEDINDKRLRAVLVINERETQVKRGENRNRRLSNSNIVVAEKNIKLNSSQKESFLTIPDLVTGTDDLTLVVILETQNHDIIGASQKRIGH